MGVVDELLSEYVQMRRNGLDTREALRALRGYIEPLIYSDKEALALQLRNWEKDRQQNKTGTTEVVKAPAKKPDTGSIPVVPPPAVTVNDATLPVRPPLPAPPREVVIEKTPAPAAGSDGLLWVECPNCKKKNRANDVFCYACGQILDNMAGDFDTRHFADATGELFNDEYFGPDSVLVLVIRDTGKTFELRPQLRQTELVIGRSSDASSMRPDVDLATADGANLGVSRLHLALRYENQDSTIQIYDLGSANGSFINGQRLHPREIRLLRSQDELRVGKLVMRVTFQHPGQELRRRR
ncbi:MAG: FHA domain-containing protein [Anaerolineae bacterium]|jgi:hypothetical protein|nr:FHA domain-containing protein [Anaerolineae bacterium]